MTPHGPWTIVDSHEVYRDRWIALRKDNVIRPDGQPGTHCVLQLKPGVSVLAVDDEGFVYLTDEFHYGIGRNCLEAVSGGIEPAEDSLLAGQRELQEELGITATEWESLGVVDPFTTIVVSPTTLYLARGLSHGQTNQEGTEQIRCVRLPFAEAVEMVLDGRISHAPTCVLILKAHIRLAK